jgi:hypothetical protein
MHHILTKVGILIDLTFEIETSSDCGTGPVYENDDDTALNTSLVWAGAHDCCHEPQMEGDGAGASHATIN